MLVVYLLLLVFLLILFILYTAIGFTFKLKVLSLEKKNEFKGALTVKWLLLSHTFSVEEPAERESLPYEYEELRKEGIIKEIKEEQSESGLEEARKTQVTAETEGKAEVKNKREIEERKPEERPEEKKIELIEDMEEKTEVDESEGKRIETGDKKEKKGIIARIRGKKEPETEETPEPWMTTREKLHWGLEAFKSLRKPMFRLFSDLLKGIKIKRLESYLTFGLSDPADTGMLCGFIHSVAGLASSRCKHCSFSVNPVFMNTMVDFRGDMEIRVRIYSLVFPMLKFMFNRKTLSFTYSIIKEKVWGKWKLHS